MTVAAPGGTRDVDVVVPTVSVTAAERAGGAVVTVRQRGVFGESLAADLIVPA